MLSSDDSEVCRLSIELGYQATVFETNKRIKDILESKNDCAFVAIREGKIAGWIHGFYSLRLESRAFVEIGGLVIDNNYRMHGIGRRLVNRVKEWGRDLSPVIRVRCNSKRMEAHLFYERLGFKLIKEQKVFDTIL